MWTFNIARDTMHQQQWLAVIEELGGYKEQLPIPNSFPQAKEKTDWSYVFLNSNVDGSIDLKGRFTEGPSLDGKGTFSIMQNKPLGQEPTLAAGPKEAHAQAEQRPGISERLGHLIHSH